MYLESGLAPRERGGGVVQQRTAIGFAGLGTMGAGQPRAERSAPLPERRPVTLRDPLTRALLALTFTTGLIDAVSYLGMGHVFAANMTGNIVLLGFGIAHAGGLPVVAPIVSLGSFLFGATLAGRVVKRIRSDRATLVSDVLAVEVGLLAIAAVLAATATIRPGALAAYVMLAVMACAMGVRNAVVRHLAVPDLTTTVLTMTLTGLAAESPLAGGTGDGSLRRIVAVAAMLAGALSGALLLKLVLYVPLALATVMALGTWMMYARGSVGRDPARRRGPRGW